MTRPIVYGARYSVYVRIVLLTLREKGVTHDVVEVDVFAEGGPPAEHLVRHPFGKIPSFEHDGVHLYEAAAIARYVDEAFPGTPLQPVDPLARARMAQAIGLLDSYAYRPWVWGLYVERVSKPKRGAASDEAKIAESLVKGETAAAALEAILGGRRFLGGDAVSLADLHAAPMIEYLVKAPEGGALLARHKRLETWWREVAKRPSVREICT